MKSNTTLTKLPWSLNRTSVRVGPGEPTWVAFDLVVVSPSKGIVVVVGPAVVVEAGAVVVVVVDAVEVVVATAVVEVAWVVAAAWVVVVASPRVSTTIATRAAPAMSIPARMAMSVEERLFTDGRVQRGGTQVLSPLPFRWEGAGEGTIRSGPSTALTLALRLTAHRGAARVPAQAAEAPPIGGASTSRRASGTVLRVSAVWWRRPLLGHVDMGADGDDGGVRHYDVGLMYLSVESDGAPNRERAGEGALLAGRGRSRRVVRAGEAGPQHPGGGGGFRHCGGRVGGVHPSAGRALPDRG